MKTLKILLGAMCLLLSASATAVQVPALVQDSLKRLYPEVGETAWSRDGNYYVADFEHRGRDTRVWLDDGGHWQMTQTDRQVMDEVPDAVFEAFSAGSYAGWQVQNVTFVQFPHWQSIIAVQVGQPNIEVSCLLLYTPEGELIRAENVTGRTDILGAHTFL